MSLCMTVRDEFYEWWECREYGEVWEPLGYPYYTKGNLREWADYGVWRLEEGEEIHWLYRFRWEEFFKFLVSLWDMVAFEEELGVDLSDKD